MINVSVKEPRNITPIMLQNSE